MTSVHVISKNGKRLMPTIRFGRVRHLLKEGQAVIVKHEPFTIQLCYDTPEKVQDLELCVDAGYLHVGTSLKSEKREYDSQQFDLLPDEKNRHDDKKSYSNSRRNRLRYRKPRFNNRKKNEEWLAPSIQNKLDMHLQIIKKAAETAPVTRITVETASFDIQALDAIEKGLPLPEGKDYQHGPRYGMETLREAVFYRDHYKCAVCGKGIGDKAILCVHHALFWQDRHQDKVDELVTLCTHCHTSSNHQESGVLWGKTPADFKNMRKKKSDNDPESKSEEKSFSTNSEISPAVETSEEFDDSPKDHSGAAFMNIVRKRICTALEDEYSGRGIEVYETDGAATKCSCYDLGIKKSHANDAYAMGIFHPVERAETQYWAKRRRNNRVIEKFYDAKYIDTRDGSVKAGKEIGCNRTNRREPRNSDKNLRIFRKQKISKGRRAVRTQRYIFQPGTKILIGKPVKGTKFPAVFGQNSRKRFVTGTHNNGLSVQIQKKGFEPKDVSSKVCKILSFPSGWKQIKKL